MNRLNISTGGAATLLLALLLSLSAGRAAAQHYIGIRGGLGGGLGRFESISTNQKMGLTLLAPLFGVTWKYYSPTRVAGAIEIDLQYVNKGYRLFSYAPIAGKGEVPNYTDTTTYTRTIRAIELPFMWQPHFYVMNRNARVFLNLGMYATYYLSQHEKQESTLEHVETFDRAYDMLSVRDNRIDFGLVGGLGFGYFFGRFEVLAEARYGFGYSDLMKPKSKYPFNTYRRTPIDRINVSVGVNYRLGRGGILAPPSLRAQRKKAIE